MFIVFGWLVVGGGPLLSTCVYGDGLGPFGFRLFDVVFAEISRVIRYSDLLTLFDIPFGSEIYAEFFVAGVNTRHICRLYDDELDV